MCAFICFAGTPLLKLLSQQLFKRLQFLYKHAIDEASVNLCGDFGSVPAKGFFRKKFGTLVIFGSFSFLYNPFPEARVSMVLLRKNFSLIYALFWRILSFF